MPTETKVAVIGCGHWGSNIVRNVARLGALGAVIEPSEAGRQRAEKLAPGIPVHADLSAIKNDASIQGVMVATPAETHYELAREAIEAGKDTYVEKPLTIDVDQAADLIERADAHGRLLMVGHVLEYHPAILKLHELVQNGTLGKLRYLISNRLNLGKIRTEENALWSFAPHDVSVILRLVGQIPFEVVATGGGYITPNVADVTVSQLLFDNGVRSHIFVSWLHPFKEQKLVVIGSKSMATYDDVTKELLLYDLQVEWHEGEPLPTKSPGVPVAFPDREPLAEECKHFLKCIETRETPRTDGLNGLRVLQILHASQQSMATNGSPVSLRSPSRRSQRADRPGEAGHARVQPV